MKGAGMSLIFRFLMLRLVGKWTLRSAVSDMREYGNRIWSRGATGTFLRR